MSLHQIHPLVDGQFSSPDPWYCPGLEFWGHDQAQLQGVSGKKKKKKKKKVTRPKNVFTILKSLAIKKTIMSTKY